ncbi:hypothetical protein R1sor_001840 [Riccia sorocarpa]|uniref:Uncharacterized protein n=1 Tax=Riccia sorocarpa TaxID=122646 RepID=A0ABD3GXF9_9MARC
MDSSRSNPLVNIRGVKRKIEEAVTMLSDFEKDGQKDVAFAALCEDGMECLQKRVADFETDLEETENELLEARGVIFQQQVKIDDAERRYNDELDRLSRLMTGLNKEVRALIKQLDISTRNRRAAADIVSATREKLARTEDRCRENRELHMIPRPNNQFSRNLQGFALSDIGTGTTLPGNNMWISFQPPDREPRFYIRKCPSRSNFPGINTCSYSFTMEAPTFDDNGSVHTTVDWVASFLGSSDYSVALVDEPVNGSALRRLAKDITWLKLLGFKSGHAANLLDYFERLAIQQTASSSMPQAVPTTPSANPLIGRTAHTQQTGSEQYCSQKDLHQQQRVLAEFIRELG